MEGIMDLKYVIEVLEKAPQNAVVSPAFGTANSYRGYYDQIAFEPRERSTVADMLEEARRANGTTYQGYKGGDYTMDLDTPCVVAEYGICGSNNEDETRLARILAVVGRMGSDRAKKPSVIRAAEQASYSISLLTLRQLVADDLGVDASLVDMTPVISKADPGDPRGPFDDSLSYIKVVIKAD